MKKILSNFKRIFTDNKEYFVKCTIMSVIAAFIFGLAITLSIPASAAGEPAVDDQVIIPAGTYRFDDVLELPNSVGEMVGIPFSFNFTTIVDGIEINVTCSRVSVASSALYYYGEYTSIPALDSSFGLPDYVMVYDDGNLEPDPSDWEVERFGEGIKTITLPDPVSVVSSYADWFYLNTRSSSDYVIEAGFYKANETINGRYLDASDDSIDIRYYDPFDFDYVDTEGMIFTIENDMALIFYGANEVFVDGWQMDAFQYIEILSDIVVDPRFYECFFGIYSPSNEGTNIYYVGFEDGYLEGRDDGYTEGYNQGYYQGLADSIGSSDTFLGGVVENILDALDKLVIVGDFSILDILKTVIGAFVVIFFLKLIAGG